MLEGVTTMYDYKPVGYYVPRRGKGDSDELGADYDLLPASRLCYISATATADARVPVYLALVR